MSCGNKEKCKGLIFSGYSQVFHSNGRLEHKQGLRLLKRASCTDCVNRRDGIWEYIRDTINEGCDLGVKGELSSFHNYKAFVDEDGAISFSRIKELE